MGTDMRGYSVDLTKIGMPILVFNNDALHVNRRNPPLGAEKFNGTEPELGGAHSSISRSDAAERMPYVYVRSEDLRTTNCRDCERCLRGYGSRSSEGRSV